MSETSRIRYDFCCYGCGAASDWDGPLTCGICGQPLSIRANAEMPDDAFPWPAESLWEYFDLLPIASRDSVVSLGEGGTPHIPAPRLASSLGVAQVLLKNEAMNPTGSFKDRQISVGISHAREISADTVAVVSSGNVACATAAYAARAGMRAVLMMHAHAAPDKVALAGAYGGRVVQVDEHSAAAVFGLCLDACKEFGWYHLSTAGIYNPFNVEGAKTIAYELYAEFGRALPDWVVAPVGGGGLLGGIWRGFLDLSRLRLIDYIPRLAGVQAAGCAPLIQAIDGHLSFQETLERPWPNPKTIAGGIADDILFDGHTALPAIRQTDGVAIAVTDDEILAAQRRLAESEGILCEPTSAVVIAALDKLPDLDADSHICCVVTGTGFKDIRALQQTARPAARIAPSLTALKSALGES